MTPDQEQRAAEPGYALVEVPPAQAGESGHSAPSEATLEDLEHRLDELQREIEAGHAELLEVEQQAKAAVEAEDAQRVAATWSEKHGLLNRISELQQEQIRAQRRLQAEVRASLMELRDERTEIERRHAQEDGAWSQLVGSLEGLLQDLRRANELRSELNDRERSWRVRLENLASRELSVLHDAKLARSQIASSRAAAPPRSARAASRRADQPSARNWAIYDPDAGKLVGSLSELLRLLARWYPTLRTEQERVREFLTLPNAQPLPDTLRQELEAAGYLEISPGEGVSRLPFGRGQRADRAAEPGRGGEPPGS